MVICQTLLTSQAKPVVEIQEVVFPSYSKNTVKFAIILVNSKPTVAQEGVTKREIENTVNIEQNVNFKYDLTLAHTMHQFYCDSVQAEKMC